ncbi:11996_t:CDS:2, partial [Racocetra fulgida]
NSEMTEQPPSTPNERIIESLLGPTDQDFDEDNEDNLFGDDDWEISFDEVDDHISEFQEDEFVREAFAKGMDLREYARNIEKELSVIEREHEIDCGLFGSGKIALQDKTSMFALGDRIDTLRNQDAGVILVHVAENKNQNSTKQYVETTYDAIGILLCIRLNTQFALELQRRRVPALEGYTNQTNMLLWPRFQAIMDMQIESLRKATNKLIVKDVHPHHVTRRYGEFSASILILNEDYNDPILSNNLLRLRNELEQFLEKMSKTFDEYKSSLIFLINNYDLIITILGVSAVEAEVNHFRELLNGQISGFVEEELQPYFGSLISFIKQVDQGKDITAIDSGVFDQISSDFAATWRQSITSINTSVIQHFSNFKNGTSILHAVLGQLIIYYTKFCNILEERMNDGSVRIKHQPVGVQSVMVEIKKFRSNF